MNTMNAVFTPTLRGSDPVTILSEPYFRAEIEATDQANIYYITSQNCERSAQHSPKNFAGFTYYGLNANSTVSTGTITATKTITEPGEYRVFIHILKMRKPHNPSMTLEIDSKVIDSFNLAGVITKPIWLDCGKHRFSSGEHELKITAHTKEIWVESFILKKVNTYSTDHSSTQFSLETKKAEYTKNTVSELNTASLDIIFKEDFYQPDNPYSKMVFDFMDPVTFFVGETRRDAKPDFGGYFTGYKLNPDTDDFTLSFGDRLLDLYRIPVYGNYSIGVGPSKDAKPIFQNYNFNNILQFIEYQTESTVFPLQYALSVPYAFVKNMGEEEEYASVTVSGGFLKKYELNIGNPAPSLMLFYDNIGMGGCPNASSVNCDAILYSESGDPPDVNEYEFLAFDYFTTGQSVVNPLRFNVVVKMYREGEDAVDAQYYTITFSSTRVEGTVIGNVTPQFNGGMASFKFNLKEAFGKSVGASSNYYITEIRLVDVLNINNIPYKWRIMYLDNISLTGGVANVPMHLDMEAKYPIDAIRKIVEDSNLDGYVRYGAERRDDAFILTEASSIPAEVEVEQGVNLLSIDSIEYKPSVSAGTGEGVANTALRHYHYKSGKTDKVGSSYYVNLDGFLRYGPWENYKDLTDVNNRSDSDKNAKEYVETNTYTQTGFGVSIRGTVLINPADYIITKIPQRFYYGNHEIKSMTNTLNLLDEEFVTNIDLNIPGNRFKSSVINMKRQLLGRYATDSRSMYGQKNLYSMGFASPGAFIQRRTY